MRIGTLHSVEISSLKRLYKIFPRNYLRIRMALALTFADTEITGIMYNTEANARQCLGILPGLGILALWRLAGRD